MANNYLSRVISALQELQKEQADATFHEIVREIAKVAIDGRITFEEKKEIIATFMSLDRDGLTKQEQEILDTWTE